MTQDDVLKEWKRIVGDAYLVQDRRTLLQILADWHIEQVKKLEEEIKYLHNRESNAN